MHGTFTFFFQNACGVEVALPTSDLDIAGSTACALVGAASMKEQLNRLLGAKLSRIKELIDYQRDPKNQML